MTLMTYHPFRSLQEDINRLFEDVFSDNVFSTTRGWSPSVDIVEKSDAFVVTAELPGVRSEDVKLNMTNNVLSLSGEKKFEREEKESNYYRAERAYGTFQRSFTFPVPVEANKIKAMYKNGVLTITVPKGEKAKPKQIPIVTN